MKKINEEAPANSVDSGGIQNFDPFLGRRPHTSDRSKNRQKQHILRVLGTKLIGGVRRILYDK